MYSNIFIVSDGCLIFDTLGFIRELEDDIINTNVWSGGGLGAMIVFLRTLGFDIDKIIDKVTHIKCLPQLVFGGNMELNGDKEILSELDEWLEYILQEKKFFKVDITLKEVYKLSGIFPNFLTFKDEVISLNPETAPDKKLKDCVLASICNIGVFEKYTIDSEEYSSFSIHDVYPKDLDHKLDNYTETMFLINYTEPSFEKSISYTNHIEDSLTRMYYKRVKRAVKKDTDVIVINGYYVKSDYDSYIIKQHLQNGKKHYEWYSNNIDTKGKMKELNNIVHKQL